MAEKEDQAEVTTVNSLLDVEKYSGESEGRMGPSMWFFGFTGVPLALFLYFFVGIIPIKIFLIPFIPYSIIVASLTFGDGFKRLEQFKRQLNDEFSSTYEISDIVDIKKDGMTEYLGNHISYMLLGFNPDHMEIIDRAQLIKGINTEIGRNFDFDTRGYNTCIADDLYRRYQGVKLFGDKEAAKYFLMMIDNNMKMAEESTLMVMTVYTIYGRRDEAKDILACLQRCIKSPNAKAFRDLVIADYTSVNMIIDEDLDTNASIEETLRKKYAKGEYYGSNVADFDASPDMQTEVESNEYERGFMQHES